MLSELCPQKQVVWIMANTVEVGDVLINLRRQPRSSDWNEIVSKVEKHDSGVTLTTETGTKLTKPWYAILHVVTDIKREVKTF